mmetsp:Transcript_11023/g.17381  ORF Transcript_11023/g.17381 Transcript_11023/m.17381 type:complete len:208 (-) Transcript_11023:2401-3024(-)
MVVLKNCTVVLLLNTGELDVDNGFLFGRNIFSNIFFDAPKHKRGNLFLKSLNLFFVGHVSKVAHKVVDIWKFERFDEVEERPEFIKIVLQWCTRHQDPTLKSVLKRAFRTDFFHAFKELSFLISETMRLVHNGCSERNLTNNVKVTDQGIVSRHKHVKLQIVRSMRAVFVVPLILPQHIAPHSLPIVIYTTNHISPTFEFTSPVLYR